MDTNKNFPVSGQNQTELDRMVPTRTLSEVKLIVSETIEAVRVLRNVGQVPVPVPYNRKKVTKPGIMQRLLNRNKCAPCGDVICVRILELNTVIKIYPDISERIDDALARHNIVQQHNFGFFLRDKPLKLASTFAQNNVHDGDTIVVNPHRLLGGSSVYSHVKISEQEVLQGFTLSDAEWEKALKSAWVKYEAYTKMREQGFFDFLPKLATAAQFVGNKEVDYFVKLAEDCLVFLYMLSKADGKTETIGAIAVYAKLRATTSLTSALFRRSLMQAVHWFFPDELQSDSCFGKVKDILANYTAFKHSPLAERLHCFMLFALGHSLFDSVGMKIDSVRLKNVCDVGRQPDAWKSADFAYLCIESIVFMCERGIQSYQMGSLQPMFHSGATHEKWLDDCQKLKMWSTCLGNPEPHGFTVFQYQNELEEAIEKGQAVVKLMATLGGREKSVAQSTLNEMMMLKSSLITTNDASKDRIEPFGVLIAGGSSVMKTTFSKILFYHYGKVMGLPTSKDYRYVRNPLDDYWSGFKSYKWCVQLDDIAAFKPTACQGVDPSVAEALQILNRVAYVTNQAELCDKGRVPMRARLVTATTNVIDLNAFAYYENDLAPRRRFPLIVKLELKPQYSKGGMCETSAIPEVVDNYHNVWIIQTYRVVPAPQQEGAVVPRQRGVLEHVRTYDDIDDFLEDYSTAIETHFIIQNKADRADDFMENVAVCGGCHRVRCNCMHLEAEEVVERNPRHHLCEHDVFVKVISANAMCVVVEDKNGKRHPLPRSALFDTEVYNIKRYCTRYKEHVEETFDPSKVVLEYNEINNVSEMYFDILRKKHERHFFKWAFTFVLQWALYVGLQFQIGRFFMRHLFKIGWTRQTLLYLIVWLVPNQVKNVSRLMYVSVDGVYKRNPRLTKIATFCTAALITYWAVGRLTRKFVAKKSETETVKGVQSQMRMNPSEQEMALQLGPCKPPTPHEVEYENMWSDHDTRQVRFSVSDMSASWAGMSWDNIHKLVKWNTVIMQLKTEEQGQTRVINTRALCVRSRLYILNRHSWKSDAVITMIFESAGQGVSANITFPASSVRWTEMPEKDLVAVEVIHAPVRKDLVKLFPKETFMGSANGMYVVRHADSTERVQLNNIRYGGEISPGHLVRIPAYLAQAARETVAGECGSPMFGQVEGATMLLGIHMAGHNRSVAAVAIVQSDIDKLSQGLHFSRISTGGPSMTVGNHKIRVGPTHAKSHTHFETGCAVQIGADEGFRPKSQSKVKPTFLAESLARRGITTDKCAPNLKSWKPFSLALKDILMTNKTCDLSLLHEAATDYVEGVLPLLPKGWEKDVHSYDLDTAINGADGVAYVDSLNKNTSAGAPCNMSKRNFLKRNVLTGKYDLTPDMAQAVADIDAEYKCKRRATPIFMAHLKDQAIPLEKVKKEKVRVFVGGPMAWTICVRQRLMWFIRLAQCHRIIFELGAGTIAQSTEWGEIYTYLTAFGTDRIVAGDFGKFDKRMGAAFILYAFWIIVQIGRKAGLSEDELDEIWCVAEDTAFAFTNFNGDLLMFLGSNPSGHPLTVIVNSLVNSLYMRYVYLQVAPRDQKHTFKQLVHLYTYGDDNIMGISRLCTWFNHTVIAEKLAEIGVEYTMADKESASVPFIDIEDASFLKRRWRYDADVGAMLAPLEESSIEGSLLVGIVSKDMTPEAHAIATIQGALNEYFFYGREVFDQKRRMFAEIIAEQHLEDWIPGGLRQWDDCVRSFQRSSEGYERVRKAFERESVVSSGQGEAKTIARAVTDASVSEDE